MELESRSFNVRNCVEEALALFAAHIRIKGLEAVYLVAPDVPSHLIGDRMRRRQILVNLIGNAIKFTSQRMFEKSWQIKTHGTRTRVRPSCLEAGMGNIVGEI